MGAQYDLSDMSLDELASWLDRADPRSTNFQRIETEFALRQTRYQERAAKASERTADATIRYTRWMAVSVVFIALAAIAQLIVALVQWMGCT